MSSTPLMQTNSFQFILRILNTNVDGRRNILYALTAIPGVGRRMANIILKKAEIPLHLRAGEIGAESVEKLVGILQDPAKFKIPVWMLNRRRDKADGKNSQAVSNMVATKLREDLENLKKVRAHRGLRHYWCIKVRGQRTGSTGRGRSYALAAKLGDKN